MEGSVSLRFFGRNFRFQAFHQWFGPWIILELFERAVEVIAPYPIWGCAGMDGGNNLSDKFIPLLIVKLVEYR